MYKFAISLKMVGEFKNDKPWIVSIFGNDGEIVKRISYGMEYKWKLKKQWVTMMKVGGCLSSIILHLFYIADQKTTNFTLFNIGFEGGLNL